jgi:hypothetical protein
MLNLAAVYNVTTRPQMVNQIDFSIRYSWRNYCFLSPVLSKTILLNTYIVLLFIASSIYKQYLNS